VLAGISFIFILAFPQALSALINEKQIKGEQIDELSSCYHLVENPHRIDHSSLLTFATAFNLYKFFSESKNSTPQGSNYNIGQH
jgi:hypothetical protein